MEVSFSVVYADGRQHTVDVWPADLRRFERHFDVPITRLAGEPRYEWLCWLAHAGYMRDTSFDADSKVSDWEQWLESVRSVEPGEVGKHAPLDSGRSPGK